MLLENEIDLVKKMDNERYRGVKSIAKEFSDYVDNTFIDASVRQVTVDEMYKNLSNFGAEKFDKIISIYNKEHPDQPLKSQAEIKKSYQPAVDKSIALFTGQGEQYGQQNRIMDNFMRSQFANIMSSVGDVHKQDIVDEISRALNAKIKEQGFETDRDIKIREAFVDVTKHYSEDNNFRLRISNFDKAEKQAESLSKILEVNTDGLSKEKAAMIKEQAQNKFKYSVMEQARKTKGDDFQATIDILDRSLDFEGRKTLDKAVQLNNKSSNINKFETRRIQLSEHEKDKSWQKFDAQTMFSKKLKNFKEEWRDIKANKEIPNDKCDSKGLNKLIIGYINIQAYISKVCDFMADMIDYYSGSKYKDQKEEAKKSESKAENQAGKDAGSAKDENNTKDADHGESHDESKTADTGSKQQESGKPDMSPFYGVVKEAYKENGKNLAVMMDIGRLNKDTAEELFVKSVSYIQTQDKLKQDELYEAFASGLQDAIADPNISFETKQVLTGFVINYEFDNYKDKIQENIEKGCRWDDIVKHQEMQLTPEEHEQLTKVAEKIGTDIANDMPAGTKEDLTKELQNRMTKFRTENPHLTRKQFARYIEAANDSMTRQIEALQKEAQKTQKTPEKATIKPDNATMANKREQRIELGEAMKEARGMAMDAIKDMKDQKKYAPVIGKMMTQISEISDKYQRLDNKQIRWVQEAAIASFTTHASDTMIDAFNAEAAKSGNTVFKKFSEDRGRKLRVSSLLNAASKVNISDRLTGKKNEFNEFRQDLADTMDVDISCKMDPPDQEKFLSDVANHIFKAEKTQLIYLSEEARKYGLKLEASEHLRDNKQIDEQCRVLVKQYENSITNPNPYFKPGKNLMAFADFTVTTKDMEGSERFLTALRKEVDKISDKDMKEKVSAAVENDIGLYKDELNKNITYIDITER
ncbi:hypothetical protein DWW20_18705 [Ruminococcus sp. AF14-5]|nr:hypothetical protein DWW20_18705 [Ruminococcus sp. AF14-5]